MRVMMHLDKDTKNMLIGGLIGSAVGFGAMTIIKAVGSFEKDKKKSPMKVLGKTISHIGEILEEEREEFSNEMFQKVEKKIKKNEKTISSFLEIAGAGLELWNKIRGI